MGLSRRRLLALFTAAFAAGGAWAQEIRVAPVVVPVAPAAAGLAAMAPAPAPLLPSVGGLALPVLVSPAAAPRVQSLASLAQAVSRTPGAVGTPVALAAGVAQAAPAREFTPVARAAALLQESPSIARLEGLGDRIEGIGQVDRSRRLNSFYDRSRSDKAAPATPVAAAPARPAGPADNGGPTGRALLEEVHRNASRGHVARGYSESRGRMFAVVDHVQRGKVGGVLEAYTQTFIPGSSPNGGDYRGGQGGEFDRDGMNAEHVWPQSFFAKKLPMRSDIHNLLPTFVHPNALRGHLPFGEVTGRPEYSNRAGAKLGGGVFEPPPAIKGRVARAILYFVARYRDDAVRQGPYSEDFFNSRLEMFLRWNREHPPTEEERRRNDLVEEFQGNRNPFTDDPALADRIGVEGFRFDSGRYKGKTLRPLSVQPHFNPQALIETAGMRPHGGRREDSRSWRHDPSASRKGGKKRR